MARSRSTGDGRGRESARAAAAALREERERAQRRRRVLVQGGVVAGLVLVVVLATVAVLSARDDAAAAAEPPPAVGAEGTFTVGAEDAPVTVRVVEDYQCPACRAFEAATGDLLAQYVESGEVAVEYRGIAFLDRASSTEYSSRALNASACVMSEGAEVWTGFHDQLFAQQPPEGTDGLSDETLVDLAVRAGADEDAVADCITDGDYRGWVEATTEAAAEDGVSGTPTVLVDGEQLESPSPQALRAAIEEALAG